MGDGWRGAILRVELAGRRSCGGEGREEAITGMAAMNKPRNRALIQRWDESCDYRRNGRVSRIANDGSDWREESR